MTRRIGLLGIATHLPAQIRTNDWWPADTVERWAADRRVPPAPGELTEAMALVLAALSAQRADPFHGVLERRVLPDDLTAADMELDAANRAIANAGIAADEIDLLLPHPAVPEYLLSNPACALHRRLGLRPACLTMQVEASGYSFMAQLTVAEQMIATGRVRHALLVQSVVSSRL